MSQNVKVYRTLEFYAQGGATRMSTIDSDDSATILYWRPQTDDTGYLAIGDGTKDMDVKVFLGTSAKYALFDVGNVLLQLEDVDLLLGDNDELRFGDASGGDVVVKWDANNLTMIPATDNTGVFEVGNDGTKSMDVKLFGATASAYMEWDNSADRLNIVTVSGRAITGEEHAFDVTMGGTLSSGDSMVGGNFAVTTSGTAGQWVSGIYAKVTQGATKNVNGYFSGAEFETINSANNVSDNFVLVLNANNSGAQRGSHESYIALRDYGSLAGNSLFWIGDTTLKGTNSATTLYSTSGAAKTHNASLRFMLDDATPVWIMCTTTAPSA